MEIVPTARRLLSCSSLLFLLWFFSVFSVTLWCNLVFRFRNGLEPAPSDPVLEQRYIEIDQESQALVGEPRIGIDAEVEAGQVADRFGADADLAVGGDGDRQLVGAARADVAHQHRGAAIDEPFELWS